MVTARVADILQIVMLAPRTETLLHGDRSLVDTRFLAEEYPLKLVHPGIGEEQCRIGLRNQGRTWHCLVAMLLKVSNEGLSQFLSAILHMILIGNGKTLWAHLNFTSPHVWDIKNTPHRMLKMAVQQGRSEQEAKAYASVR